jgi:5-methylcytosine-specific restriction endonuclease McrA
MIIPIDVVFKYIDEHPGELRMSYEGYKFSIRRSIAHKAIGLTCVVEDCGRTGEFYALELWKGGQLHLDLYTTLSNGSEVLMTIDHILPKSKGGPDEIPNYQMMCCTCNAKKADKVEEKIMLEEFVTPT